MANYTYRLSAALIEKNEGRYLKEWLEYHLLMGVEHFYVYDHGSTDKSVEVLTPYVERGIVELFDVDGEHHPAQMEAYNDAVERSRGVTKYLAFIDADEFLMPMKHDRAVDAIEEIFDHYEKTPFKFMGSCEAGGIGVNWRVFGTSGHEAPVDGLVTDEYRYRGPDDLMINCHIKTICRPEAVRQIINPHFVIYNQGYWCISEHGSLIPAAFFYDSKCDLLRVNHYYTKSESEYRTRRMNYVRAEAGPQRLATEEEVTHTNEVRDDGMDRFLPALREAMERN
jgi:glycosyltransferase involved in cell wall biosynthesis